MSLTLQLAALSYALRPPLPLGACAPRYQPVGMRLFDERNPKDDDLAWWELREDPDGPLQSSERFAMYSLPVGFALVSIIAYSLSWLFPVRDGGVNGGIASVSIPFFIALWLIDTSFDRR